MATPREHVEAIRKTKFSIGGELNPLTEDLHQAVKNLSAELYAKDVHFLMELIQNAEDNDYLEGVDPSLEFVVTSRDITATGAEATLLIFNNERGFSPKNIDSICSVGRSTKKGNRKRGYIGEKGIGFKSVFLISARPYIFSNGYQIRFNEEPCPRCNVGYIVPEWVEDNPTISDITKVYGSGTALPTTTIVLPLKADKVKPVKQQLSSIHPEVLLFLTKIKRLSVKEDNKTKLNTLSAVSISSETNFMTRKNIDAESYTLHLNAEESRTKSGKECSYYMWKQKFPVRQENKVERRMEVEEWQITLAFPNGERLNRGMNSPGVYAFLPTEMVTNFPFIIQADFVLASSRETILLDDKWNQGILDCIPSAFINAFTSLVKNTADAPVSSLPAMFGFLPVNSSTCQKLNAVRESIREKLVEESIVPSESYMKQKFFHKPREVGRIMPAFWDILKKAREQRVSLHNLSSHGIHILNCSFDKEEYNNILNFLGVESVDNGWYAKCIRSSNLVLGLSEDVYLELLLFLADNWRSKFHCTDVKNIPLVKYVGLDGTVSLCTINESSQRNGGRVVCLSKSSRYTPWLIVSNKEFRCITNCFFVPHSTQEAIRFCSKKETVLEWLKDQGKVGAITMYDYAVLVNSSICSDEKLVISYVHFLRHSLLKDFLSEGDVRYLCGVMPLVDNCGCVTTRRKGVLVPGNGSKWAELIGSNPWTMEGYVELGEVYLNSGYFAGEFTTGKQLIDFLGSYVAASDIPNVSPPNAVIPTVNAPLTMRNAFLLLDWIRNLKYKGISIPDRFLTCIKNGSWLKITMNGSPGFRPPSQSFQLTESCGTILQNGSVLVDIPLIDQSFYGSRINEYTDELKTIGVMFEYGEACAFIGDHLMSLAASASLTRGNVLSILNFIRFLREKFLSPDKFIHSIRENRWLRTTRGDRSPVRSVLLSQEWKASSQVSYIPFIDQGYYGDEIFCFKTELQLLGVVVGFNQNYQLVIDNLKSPSDLVSLTAEAFLLMLECLRQSTSSIKLAKLLKDVKCLKTNVGYNCPGDSFFFDPEWGCLLQVFNVFPFIDQNFYGRTILSYKDELKQTGVVVEFEEAVKRFVRTFRQRASSSSISKENVVSFLACYRQMKGTNKFPPDLKKCIREMKWLRTRLGDFRSPGDCILFGPGWESISQITLLPFIDDSDNYYGKGIHEYKNELKSMGVVVDFKKGAKFVAANVFFPQPLFNITPANVFSLLECVRILMQEKDYSFPDVFLKKISQNWLKTCAGYRSPDKCLLFDSKWGALLKPTDGPFIDDKFYGSRITSYMKELSTIGVIVDVKEGCHLLADHLDFHSEFSTIVRIYSYLSESNWKPESEASRRIWIPNGSYSGEWVSPGECVLHDKDGLFGLQYKVLDKHYERNLLSFFTNALDVQSNPSVDDYCQLWKIWESSGHQLLHVECCAFWTYIMRHWSSKTEKILADKLVKLPVDSGSDGILLIEKRDVFIADDLQLKDIFEQVSPRPMFVWYPQQSPPSLPRTKLLEVYRKIGVRTISESIQKEELSSVNGVECKQLNPNDISIGKDLVRLILSFLADPSLQMEAERRHEAVQGLLKLSVVETVEPITAGYTLSLSTGEIVNARPTRMVRWDREGLKFFTQKVDRSSSHRNLIEYATYFSEVISEGLLWEKEDHICALSELIKLAFLVEFNKEAIGFLMKSKNLQIFMEDEEFLSSAFPSD